MDYSEKAYRKAVILAACQQDFLTFVRYTKPDYSVNWHHEHIANRLQEFALGKVKKLALFCPPQVGKSELASRRLVPWLFGLNPDLQINLSSYSDSYARKLNRNIQRIMATEEYKEVFPATRLNERNVATDARGDTLKNSHEFEVVGRHGYFSSQGTGGSLSGKTADVLLIDDPHKGPQDAQSPVSQAMAWEWYTDAAKTRLHNDSGLLLIMTRWHKNDLAGRILRAEPGWEVVSFEAIKETEHPYDPRPMGAALWPERHSLEGLIEKRSLNPVRFQALYQQQPGKASGQVFNFGTHEEGQVLCYGLDFGFVNDQTALVRVSKGPRGGLVYHELLYEQGLNTADIIAHLRTKANSGHTIWADSAEPRLISEIKQAGFSVKGAPKGRGSVKEGIDTMLSRPLFMTNTSHNLSAEAADYVWLLNADGNPTNEVSAVNDHLLDAARYATFGEFGKRTSTPGVQHIRKPKPQKHR